MTSPVRGHSQQQALNEVDPSELLAWFASAFNSQPSRGVSCTETRGGKSRPSAMRRRRRRGGLSFRHRAGTPGAETRIHTFPTPHPATASGQTPHIVITRPPRGGRPLGFSRGGMGVLQASGEGSPTQSGPGAPRGEQGQPFWHEEEEESVGTSRLYSELARCWQPSPAPSPGVHPRQQSRGALQMAAAAACL